MGIAQVRFGFTLVLRHGNGQIVDGNPPVARHHVQCGSQIHMMLHVRFLTFFVRFMPLTSCSPVIPVLSGGLQSHLTPSEGTVAASKLSHVYRLSLDVGSSAFLCKISNIVHSFTAAAPGTLSLAM